MSPWIVRRATLSGPRFEVRFRLGGRGPQLYGGRFSRRKDADPASITELTSIADEAGSFCQRTALVIGLNFVRHEIADGGPARVPGHRRDVQIDLQATVVGRDEAEASVVPPLVDASLVAHAFPAVGAACL